METKYYIDQSGNYIGGFCGLGALALVPVDAIEISTPPPIHASQVWSGSAWGDYTE